MACEPCSLIALAHIGLTRYWSRQFPISVGLLSPFRAAWRKGYELRQLQVLAGGLAEIHEERLTLFKMLLDPVKTRMNID